MLVVLMIVINWNDEFLEKRLWSEMFLFMLCVLYLKNIFREIISVLLNKVLDLLYFCIKYVNI